MNYLWNFPFNIFKLWLTSGKPQRANLWIMVVTITWKLGSVCPTIIYNCKSPKALKISLFVFFCGGGENVGTKMHSRRKLDLKWCVAIYRLSLSHSVWIFIYFAMGIFLCLISDCCPRPCWKSYIISFWWIPFLEKRNLPKSEFQDRGDPRGLGWEITVVYYSAFSAYGDLKLTLKDKGHLPKVTRLSVPELRCRPHLVDWNLCSLSQIHCRDAFGNTGEGDSRCLLE